MKKFMSKLDSILMMLSGLIMIGAIKIWAPVCQSVLELYRKNGDVKFMSMKCAHTSKLLLYLSIILIIMGLVSSIRGTKFGIVPIVIGALMILSMSSDYGIGMCRTGVGMECEQTRLWIYSSGSLAILSGIMGMITKRKNNSNTNIR